jgi:hypothetical protein
VLTAGAIKRRADDPEYDHDVDRDEQSVVEYFPATEAGLKAAREKARAIVDSGVTVYGTATIQQEVVDNDDLPYGVGEWVPIGETEYVD